MSQPKKSKSQSLETYSPVLSINEQGVIYFKDGRAGVMFEIQGVDGSFLTENEWERLHESLRPLVLLKEDEELQFCFSRRSDFESLIDKKMEELELVHNEFTRRFLLRHINALIEEIRLEDPKIFRSKIVLTYSKYFDKYEQKRKNIERVKATLAQKCYSVQHAAQQANLKAQVLTKPTIIRTMASFASGENYVQTNDIYDEWPSIEISPREVLIEDKEFRALTLKSLPEKDSQMGMMRALTELPVPMDITVRLKGKDRTPLKKKLDRKKKILFSLSQDKPSGDAENETQYEELDGLLKRLSDQQDALLEMSLTIGLRAKKEHQLLLRRAITEILQTQASLGHLEFEEAALTTFDCFLEAIPGFKGKVFHQQLLLASNSVHFLPLFEQDEGDERPIATYGTRDGGLFSIHPFHYQLANYNWLVSGTSGAGKSFFVNSLLLQSMSLNPRVFIVDIGGSYYKLTRFLGGDCIGLNIDETFKMGPFFMPPSENSHEESRRREHIQLVFWELLRDENKIPSVEERAILHEVLLPYFQSSTLLEHPISAIREDLKNREESKANRLAMLLERWCAPSFFGDFLDNNQPLETNESCVMFDLKGLNDFEDLSRVVQLIICASLWSTIRKGTTRPTYIVLDEVAFSLLRYQPQFVEELVSTVRKHNAGVITIAQDLEKITSNPAGASLLQNSQMKAILQQRGDQRSYSEPLGLNDEEKSAIRYLDRQKGSFSDIFLMIDDRRAVIRFSPNILEYCLGTTVPSETRQIEDSLSNYTGPYQERMLQYTQEYAT